MLYLAIAIMTFVVSVGKAESTNVFAFILTVFCSLLWPILWVFWILDYFLNFLND